MEIETVTTLSLKQNFNRRSSLWLSNVISDKLIGCDWSDSKN